MPEGDTVYRAAAQLHRALSGQLLLRADLRVPQHATARLDGMRVDAVIPRGKHVLHRLSFSAPQAASAFTAQPPDGEETTPAPHAASAAAANTDADAAEPGTGRAGLILHTTLGMDGAWRLVPPGEPWGVTARRVRIVLETAAHCAIGVDLPVVELVPRAREQQLLAHLGPDLLGEDWDEQRAAHAIAGDGERQIAAALLDQRNLAGLGNEYVVELCFLLGIRPTTPVRRAGDPLRIVRLARRLILANRDRVARTTTGDTRRGQRSWVHRREGAPCRRCGETILSGRHDAGARGGFASAEARLERLSWFCPRCQPDHDSQDPSGARPPVQ